MSNRLTKRGSCTQRDIDKLLDLTDENQIGRIDAYIKLQQYEDLEEDGLLLRLPVNPPCIVYKLEKHYTPCSLEGIEYSEIDCDCGCLYFGTSSCDSKKQYRIKEEFIRSLSSLVIIWQSFGKIRFATKEGAKERIKQLEGDNEETKL